MTLSNSLKQVGSKLQIDNCNLSENESEQELGFGFGLELTERLLKQYSWHYENAPNSSGRSVVVEFRS